MSDGMDWDDEQARRQGSTPGGGAATAPAGGYGRPAGGYDHGYPPMGGYGNPYAIRRPMRVFPIETKPFFLTSEFAVYALATTALIITTADDDSIDAWRFWILQAGLTAFYLLSRGMAKSGTKSRSWDPREEMLMRAREGMDRD